MVGKQLVFSTYSLEGIYDLHQYVVEGIIAQLEIYGFDIFKSY